MRVCVIIASKGRPKELTDLLRSLQLQSHPPNQVIVSVTSESDLPAVSSSDSFDEIRIIGPVGSSRQRNTALSHADRDAELVAFLDDDLVPHTAFLAEMQETFSQNPSVVGAEGRLLADGAATGAIDVRAANESLSRVIQVRGGREPKALASLYGCNMVVRSSVARDLRFDEALPLYGYMEDRDYSTRLAARGQLVSVPSAVAVHLGSPAGRTGARRLGYSQIANVLYLYRKGTFGGGLLRVLVALGRPLTMNMLLSVAGSEKAIRRERARGNRMALADLLRNRLHPERVLAIAA